MCVCTRVCVCVCVLCDPFYVDCHLVSENVYEDKFYPKSGVCVCVCVCARVCMHISWLPGYIAHSYILRITPKRKHI